ncbi:hypothetical protein [Mycobacterium botniense]|uniref:Transmembrane protein n=1 Tax=Mycobacterium botniense TaxID=84962 RepID=A0A7I9XWD2_9MYCO|nr:hypothetical protein [Mycobacterium botniense]GFG74086.1 hypothetical protein MBOT_14510 [Mycobacterium botniense]
MGRTIAMLWHASFSIAAGVLYFFFVLPRWPELMGDTPHALGTALRIGVGALIALAALPVVFSLLRARKPEYGTPQLALSLRTGSIVAHVVAGVLIVGTAISEIWLSLDAAGRWLFGIYGAAAAIAVLAIFGFYLSFVAELPPPPPKPKQRQEPKQRRRRRRQRRKDRAEAVIETTTEAASTTDTETTLVTKGDHPDAESTEVGQIGRQQTVDGDTAAPAEESAAATTTPDRTPDPESALPEPVPDDTAAADTGVAAEPSRQRLRNRRPTGKSSTLRRRRRSRGGVAVDE